MEWQKASEPFKCVIVWRWNVLPDYMQDGGGILTLLSECIIQQDFTFSDLAKC